MLFDSSRRLRRIREERQAQNFAVQRAMFDRSRGVTQDRLVEVVKEFEWLRPEQKALLLRETPTFYLAAAKLHAVHAIVQRNRGKR